jgi:hypothetical protein
MIDDKERISDKRRAEIEQQVRGLHLEVLQGGRLRFNTGLPPITQQLSPEVAIEKCGFSVERRPSLPSANGGAKFEVAGAIDFNRRIVYVKSELDFAIQRFTLAHELGHLVLHEGSPAMEMHRERAVDRENLPNRPLVEREADYFGVRYVAPDKTVEHMFERVFGHNPLVLNDENAYYIAKTGAHDLFASSPDGLAFAIAVARADSFNGRPITPLTKIFGLSPTAMGIRLKELKLVAY